MLVGVVLVRVVVIVPPLILRPPTLVVVVVEVHLLGDVEVVITLTPPVTQQLIVPQVLQGSRDDLVVQAVLGGRQDVPLLLRRKARGLQQPPSS